MLNKVAGFLRSRHLVAPGDHVICAVSGGADSMALLWCMVLLRKNLGISVSAAHFNHHLRHEESDRDQAFVRDFCAGHGIPFLCGEAEVLPGKKGLEAAAREARYGFFSSLDGKVATAHTADDNAETVLMHLVRGTGLKGLGGIAPSRGNLIRPMLTVTREEVERFLKEYFIPHVEDSSNASDTFLRNRIRHGVLPLLQQENPRFSGNVSRMALLLREDEAFLSQTAETAGGDCAALRTLPMPVRYRALEKLLKENGVREPEAEHLRLADRLVFSENPSARASFPGGVTFGRVYGRLEALPEPEENREYLLNVGETLTVPEWNVSVICRQAREICSGTDRIPFSSCGQIRLRSRKTGDTIRLPGGTKTLKKLMIDRKIPAHLRCRIPVAEDDAGIIAVFGIGGNLDRIQKTLPAAEILFLPADRENDTE